MESAAAYKRRLMKWKAEQWPKDHPNGQFIIHRYNPWCQKTRKRTNEIKFNIGFKTAIHSGKGVCRVPANPVGYYMRNAVFNHDETVMTTWGYPSGSSGVTRYETKEQFLVGCERFDVPGDIVEFCLELHEKWLEGKNGS